MRLCRFNENRLGLVLADGIRDVTFALSAIPGSTYPFPRHDMLIAQLPEVQERILAETDSGERIAPDEVSLLSPVANPGKLLAAPVNYKAHLDEAIADEETFSRVHTRQIQETGLFLKATSSLIGAGSAIKIWHPERRTDHEIELAVIMGKSGRDIGLESAMDHVAGYSIGLDITIRGPEERSLRKSLDSYSVLGPWFVTADEMSAPHALDLELTVDGEVRQRANTRDLIMDIPALISFASSFYTLEPGDVLYTGTPEGVGPIVPGNEVEASITGLGSLKIPVEQAR